MVVVFREIDLKEFCISGKKNWNRFNSKTKGFQKDSVIVNQALILET